VRIQAKQTQGRGSALVWILVWLIGVISIAWVGINYTLPRFETKLQTAVQESISAFNADPVYVSARGRAITISGELASSENAQAVIAAANETVGVGTVTNDLVIIEASSNNATPIPLNVTKIPDDTVANSQTESPVARVTTKILSESELAQLEEQAEISTSSTISALTDENSTTRSQLNKEQLALLDATVSCSITS